jgi:hypothetical protein
MIMPIGEYPFDGPHKTLRVIENKPGVFAVICEHVDKYYLLDIDSSKNVKESITTHERKKCWENYKKGKIRYAVLYDESLREGAKKEIIDNVRKKYKTIPCG